MFNRRWLWLYVSCLAVVALLVDVAWYYPQLPQQVPLHFGAAGQPDNWGTKQELVGWLLAAVVIVVTLLVPAVGLIKVLPASLINLPHRDYWLAPEREATTRRELLHRMGWFACATIVFLGFLFHSSLHAAFRQPPGMDSPLAGLVAYLGFVGLWLGEMLWRFRRRGDEGGDRTTAG